jgi:hypothetical protein
MTRAKAWSANFSAARVFKNLDAAKAPVSGLRGDLEKVANGVRDNWREKINADGRASGTGFASDVLSDVTEPRRGGYNVRVGWLQNRPASRSTAYPGTSWYVFQDSGFRHYRSGNWIEGVGAFLDARDDLRRQTAELADRTASKIARALRGK